MSCDMASEVSRQLGRDWSRRGAGDRRPPGALQGSGLTMDAVSAALDGPHCPPGEVRDGVVPGADEDEVIEVGGAAVGPAFLPVMGIRPGGGAVAVLDRADPLLLEEQSQALWAGRRPALPP